MTSSSRRPWGIVVAVVLAAAVAAVGGYVIGSRDDSSDPPGSPQRRPASTQSSSTQSSTPDPADIPGVSECGNGRPVPRPEEVVLTCADGGITVQEVQWQVWGPRLAVGSATVRANTCDPTCADGVFVDYPVTVVLDRVVENGAGPQFTRLVTIYADQAPFGDSDTSSYELQVASGG